MKREKRRSSHIIERRKNTIDSFFFKSIQIGDYIICIDDESTSKMGDILVPTTEKEKKFYGSFIRYPNPSNVLNGKKVTPREYKSVSSYKLKSVTFDKSYKVINIKNRNDYHLKTIKIIGDNGTGIWMQPERFDFDIERSINDIRFNRLSDILKDINKNNIKL